jgi:hypothetical protein
VAVAVVAPVREKMTCSGAPPGAINLTSRSPTQVWAGASVKLTATFVAGAETPETVKVTSRLAPNEVQAAGPSGMAPKVPALAGKLAAGTDASEPALVMFVSAPIHKTVMARLKTVTPLSKARVTILIFV